MYPHQTDRLTSVLDRGGLEALVAASPENIAYLTGFRSLAQEIYRRTPLFAVFSRQGVALVAPMIELPAIAAAGVEVATVHAYGEFFLDHEPDGDVSRRVREWSAASVPTAAEALAHALEALGVRRGPVGLDDTYLAFDAWHRAGERLAPLKVVPAGTYFVEARTVKGPYEIECLERALHVAEDALNEVIQALAPGMTEREAVRVYETRVLERGGAAHARIVAFGDRSAIPAPYPSARALKAGELVRFEVGALVNGYYADVARTAVAGAPSTRHESVHGAIDAALAAAVDTIRAGVRGERVFAAAITAARAHGLPDYRRHHVGHGIGLEPYEPPTLAAGEDTELESGMVLRVETPYYLVGWGGVTMMDTVLVMRSGARVMNRAARGLVLLD